MDPVGRTIGKYEILRVIGAGGFGTVYEGRDPFIKRRVAVKTCTAGGPEIRNRFFREAEIAGNLHHRNVVTVHDFGVHDEVPYLVQEYLEGEDLNGLIAGSRIPGEAEKVDVLIQVARGLAYAHSREVIHRDVKPANVRVLPDGTVKIMDFGIAKLANVESDLTKTGMTLGTAAFLAPEQIRGAPIDQRVDHFSFGVLAYELFAGRRPFRGRTISALFSQILEQKPEPLRSLAPACPPALEAIIMRCLEKNPAQRYPDMGAVEAALVAVRDEMHPTQPLASALRQREIEDPADVARLADRVADLIGQSSPAPAAAPRKIDAEIVLAELDRALQSGAVADAAALVAVLERRGGQPPPGLAARRRRLDQLRREERDARVRDCLTRARGLLAIDQLEAALAELERAVELQPMDEALVRLRDEIQERVAPPTPLALEEQRRAAEQAAERGDWIAAEAALKAAEHRHGRQALTGERSRLETARGRSLDDQIAIEVARADGLIRDGELREAFDRLRWVLEVDPTHAAAQSLLEQARNAVAAPHGSLSGEAALLEVSRIITAGSPLAPPSPRRKQPLLNENTVLIGLFVLSVLVLVAAILLAVGLKP